MHHTCCGLADHNCAHIISLLGNSTHRNDYFALIVHSLCRTLEVLQDRVVPRPYEEIEQVLHQELGGTAVTDVFAEFEQGAIAAASLAQVSPL